MANGDFDFVAGQVLTAAQVDDYLMLQAKMEFATSGARDAALTTRKREGTLTHQADANSMTIYSGAAWSTIGPVHGPLTTFDPVITQSGAVAHTVNSSTYQRVGRNISWRFTLTCSGAGTAANVVTVSLPVNNVLASDMATIGTMEIYDTSANTIYGGPAVTVTAGTIRARSRFPDANVGFTYLGTLNFTAALAAGDIITGCVAYECASDA